MAGMVLCVYILGPKITELVIPLAILSGLGLGIFNSSFQPLVVGVVSSKYLKIYASLRNIIIFALKTVVPILLGSIIDFGSFSLVTVVVLIIAVLMVVFASLIREPKKNELSYDIKGYIRTIRSDKEKYKSLKVFYLSSFFRSMTFEVVGTLFTIMILLNSGSDFKLGYIQTIFTATQLISTFVFLKAYHKKRAGYFTIIPCILIILSGIPMFVTLNEVTILILFGVYTFLRVFFTSITDTRRSSIIRTLSLHSHSLEHNSIVNLIYIVGRVSAYSMLFLSLVLDIRIVLYICWGVIFINLLAYVICLLRMENLLILQDKKWQEEHPMSAVEKSLTEKQPIFIEYGDLSSKKLADLMNVTKNVKKTRKRKGG